MKKCRECGIEYKGRAYLYCPACRKKRNTEGARAYRALRALEEKQALVELQELDGPMRLEKLISLAINVAL